jgi:hypothetical protein
MALARRHRIPQDIEDAILRLAAEQPALGRVRVAAELTQRGLEATPSTVRSVWQRYGLQNAAKRIAAFAPPADEIVAAAPADEIIVIPAPHEIPPNPRSVPEFMSDALVFSVAVLSALSQDSGHTLDQPVEHDIQPDPIMQALADDQAALAHVPVEAADLFQPANSHFDFFVT